jgi:tetratricopeptide (TPR) repeat protein
VARTHQSGEREEPIRSLFAELRNLHRRAGEPSTRVVARSLGRGVLSHTTVHAVLRGPRVPRWRPLELVVRQLGGDIEQVRELWIGARNAEDQSLGTASSRLHVPDPVIGRKRELDNLRVWIDELATGHGRVVLIEGEPGIGKSSLVRSAAVDAEAAGCRVLWATCDELSQAFPLQPLLDAVDGAGPGEGSASIAATFHADAAPGNRVDLVAAATERIIAAVDALCAPAPVMLVVDDLQWADSATVLTMGRLSRLSRRLPLLLVGVARPVPQRQDLAALRRAIDRRSRVRLSGLSDAEATEFVARIAGGEPGHLLLQLAEGAAGNPLYLTELVDALARGSALTALDGQVEFSGDRTPDSLAAAIADRLGFISASVRTVLQAAALLGADFSVSDLAMISGQAANELLPILDEAIVAGVLREDGHRLAFRHPLIRAALYEETPAAMRATLHRESARAMAEGHASPERVARQLLPAFDLDAGMVEEWMVQWLADAGQQLVARAPDAAASLLRMAVDALPAGNARRDLLACRLADALYRAGRSSDAAAVASAAITHALQSDILVDLHWTLAQCRVMEGRAEEALATLDHAIDSPFINVDDRTRLRVLAARINCILGRLGVAGQLGNSALAAATLAGDRCAVAWALNVLTAVHGMCGRARQALPLFDRALAITQGDVALADLRLVLQINQAATLGSLDQHEAALRAAEQARHVADEAGNAVRLGQAQSVLIEMLFVTGRWDDALVEVDLAPPIAKEPVGRCADHSVAAIIALHRSSPDASRHLFEVERNVVLLGDRVLGLVTLARSLDRERMRAPAEALGVLTESLSLVGGGEEGVDLLADALRLAVSFGRKEIARDLVVSAEAMAVVCDTPRRQAVKLHCRGLLDGDPLALVEAASQYDESGRLLARAQALEAAAVAFADAGNADQSRAQLAAARSCYAELGAEWDLARIESRVVPATSSQFEAHS